MSRHNPVAEEVMVARIAGVSARDASLRVKLAYWFTRRGLARATGREPERGMIAPVEMYAHVPGLLLAGLVMGAAPTPKRHRVDERLRTLAELKAVTLTRCEWCIDFGSQIARRRGLSDEELGALPSYQSSLLFSDLDKLVLDYAACMSYTPVEVPDALFTQLRRHFDEGQLVELTYLIALENLRSRFNRALDVEAAGFSEGMTCAVPATTRKPAPGNAATN